MSDIRNKTYAEAVKISRDYLGPAAERFIERQVRSHLNKDPADLQPHDLYKLLDWIRISVSFLSEDADVVEDYVHQLRKLASKGVNSNE